MKKFIFLLILITILLLIPSRKTFFVAGEVNELIVEKETVVLKSELVRICACESRGNPDATPTHYESDGVTVLTGRINPKDIGICQINLYWHEKQATDMELDLFVENDNIKYANWLFEKDGLTPWRWSKPCWKYPQF